MMLSIVSGTYVQAAELANNDARDLEMPALFEIKGYTRITAVLESQHFTIMTVGLFSDHFTK